MGESRLGPSPKVDGVIVIPLADRVWMPPWKTLQFISLVGPTPKRPYFLDLKETKNSMVTVSTILTCEKPKKEESITNTNSLLCQMRLGGASLAKRTSTLMKHRVLVA
jgi:hypothetical protein